MIMLVVIVVIVICIVNARESMTTFLENTWLNGTGMGEEINVDKNAKTFSDEQGRGMCRDAAKNADRNVFLHRDSKHNNERHRNTCVIHNLKDFSTVTKNTNKPGHYLACTNANFSLDGNCTEAGTKALMKAEIDDSIDNATIQQIKAINEILNGSVQ